MLLHYSLEENCGFQNRAMSQEEIPENCSGSSLSLNPGKFIY